MILEGTVTSCVFDKEWQPPTGKMLYFHTIELLNGDKGNVGTAEKMPDKLKEGSIIYYTIIENRIKLTTQNDYETQSKSNASSKPTSQSPPKNNDTAPKKSYYKNPQDAITFIFGYASNRHVAKITALKKDIPLKELTDDADKLYAHYLKMLSLPIK